MRMFLIFQKLVFFLLTSIYSGGFMNGWWLGLGIFCWIYESLLSFNLLNAVKSLLPFLNLNICTKFVVIMTFFTLWRSRNGTARRLLWNTQVIHKFRAEYHLEAFIFVIIFSRRISWGNLWRLSGITKAFSE